jgi:hypothetical protein
MRSAAYALQAYLDCCTQYRPPPLWADWEAACDGYACPEYETPVLAYLTENCLTAELTAAGLVRADEHGLILNANLFGKSRSTAVARATPKEQPHALFADGGCYGAHTPAACLDDEFTRDRLGRGELPLIVAAGPDDLILLRACGFPATTAYDLPCDTAEQWRRLALRLQRSPHATAVELTSELLASWEPPTRDDETPPTPPPPTPPPTPPLPPVAERPPLRLALADWSLATVTLDRPTATAALARHWATLSRQLGYDLSWATVWRPCEQTLDALRFALAFRDAQAVREILRLSLRDEQFPLERPTTTADRRLSRCEAWAELRHALRTDASAADPRRLRLAQQTWEESLERELIEPLRDLARGESDPRRGSLSSLYADIASAVHRQAPDLDRLLHAHEDVGTLNGYLKLLTQLRLLQRDLQDD